jgi:hypothetical protein
MATVTVSAATQDDIGPLVTSVAGFSVKMAADMIP